MRAVRRQRLTVGVARHVLAVADGVAVVVAGVTEADRDRVAALRRQLVRREVAFDRAEIDRLAVGLQRVRLRVPPVRGVVDLGFHVLEGVDAHLQSSLAERVARVRAVVRAGNEVTRRHVEVGPAFLHVGRARVVEAVPLVALRCIRSRFERLDQVALRFARAACKQDVADAHGLELDAQVLLDGTERRRVVVGGDRNAGLDQ